MSAIKKYIEEIKEKTKNLTSIEQIRYIYIDMGKRFSFDLNYSFGNSKTRRKIYEQSALPNKQEEAMQTNEVICKTTSKIFEYIMRELGHNVATIASPYDEKKCKHVYNILTLKTGENYLFDLQEDMRNIKARRRTKYFGVPQNTEEELTTRHDLEQIDKKINYISEQEYYTDEYLELMKITLEMFEDLSEKVEFALTNLEAYTDSKMNYADRKWRMEDLIGTEEMQGQLFSQEEKRKIHMIDCCVEKEGKKEYKLVITVDTKKEQDVYIFNEDKNTFEKITMEQLVTLVENGLTPLQGIPKLKSYMKKQNKEER